MVNKTRMYSPTGCMKRCRRCGWQDYIGIIICRQCGYDFIDDLPSEREWIKKRELIDK